MVIYEDYGDKLVRAYSNEGFYIHGGNPEGDYDEAIDPAVLGRTYTETDVKIPEHDVTPTVEDKAEAYDIIVGEEKDD